MEFRLNGGSVCLRNAVGLFGKHHSGDFECLVYGVGSHGLFFMLCFRSCLFTMGGVSAGIHVLLLLVMLVV